MLPGGSSTGSRLSRDDSLVGGVTLRNQRSTSYYDVAAVNEANQDPPKANRQNQLLEKSFQGAEQVHEDDPAFVVLVFEPQGTSLMMGGLHPRASLFERPVNMESAQETHERFRTALRNHGVKVLTVREVLAHRVDLHVGARLELERMAGAALTYAMESGYTEADLREEDRKYVTEAYKQEVLQNMGVGQLIDTISLNPTVRLVPTYRDTGLTAHYSFQPLANLVYTRDQQVTTAKGLVMGRLRSQQRSMEVTIMQFCFKKLGISVIGAIQEPGYLEGGDFFPCGRDLALLGVGLRSNVEAAKQLMDRDLLGTRRLAVVKDDFEQHQDRMHLDCVFSILGRTCCLMYEPMMGEESPSRRLVDEYVRDARDLPYRLSRSDVEFSAFMRGEGFHIIPISQERQLRYACNVLNLGESQIMTVDPTSARQIAECPHFTGDIQVIEYSQITSMYGAVHCSSQVIKRTARE